MPALLMLLPLAELFAWYRFIEIFSFLDAVVLVLTGGVLGALIMILQGRSAVMQAQASLIQGKVPTNAILHRGIVMFGGLLIFLPGILSKVVGFAFVMPGIRHLTVWYMKWVLAGKLAKGSLRVFMAGGFPKDFNPENFNFGNFRPPPNDMRDVTADPNVVDVVPNKIEHKKENE